jgi:hypothetical protein
LVEAFGKIICLGYVTRIGDIRNAYKILILKLEARERLRNLGNMQAQETADNTNNLWECEIFRLDLNVCKLSRCIHNYSQFPTTGDNNNILIS